jgi:pimeloyl-ACP methyl ester carboxylesterase
LAELKNVRGFYNDLDEVVTEIEHVFTGHEPGQVSLEGYSMGGIVTLAVAIRHPDLVDRVAINGSYFGKTQDAWEPAAFKQFMNLPANFAPPMLKDPSEKVAPDPKQWPVLVAKVKKLVTEFKGFSRDDMKSIKAPVLITLGDHDGVRVEHVVEMFRLIPNSQLAVFPGSDHLQLWTSPDTVLSPITAFLNAPARPAQ